MRRTIFREEHRPALRIAAYVLIVVAMAWGLWRLKVQNDAIEQQATTDQYLSCIALNDTRDTVADLLVAAGANGPTPDFTKIPSFADLGPRTQQFLNDYAAALAVTAGNNALKDFVATQLVLRDCEALFPGARHVHR